MNNEKLDSSSASGSHGRTSRREQYDNFDLIEFVQLGEGEDLERLPTADLVALKFNPFLLSKGRQEQARLLNQAHLIFRKR